MAFPAISCGAFRFPLFRAAKIAVETIHQELASFEALERVVLAAFDDRVEGEFMRALKALHGPTSR